MWHFILLPLVMIALDYFKKPIDRLYFQRPLRPLVGVRNTLVDMLMYKPFHEVDDYPGLWRMRLNFRGIRDSYFKRNGKAKRYYFHDMDSWFEKNDAYYYHKLEDFPEIDDIVKSIPCAKGGMIAVMDGPVKIPPHRAESNMLLRYHMTIEGTSTLDTEYETHEHAEGEDFIFDHARYHEVEKTTSDRRVVLILDVKRF